MDHEVRVDVWLWAVRIFRSRSQSSAACKAGKVSVNGAAVKPSKLVRPGDTVQVRVTGRLRILEVVHTPTRRLGAPLAAEAMIDNSPAPEPRPGTGGPTTKPAQRDPGAGRPTKRDRRQIDRFRGR